jgi:hypothetical protein
VAEAVVDELEPVEVEEQDRDGGVAPRRVVEGESKAVDEQYAVRQARERVVQGLASRLLFGAAAFERLGEDVRGRFEEGELVGGQRRGGFRELHLTVPCLARADRDHDAVESLVPGLQDASVGGGADRG